MEATGQLRQASPSSQAFDALKARVVTRSFGVRIGSFGVDYTSKKVVLDPEEQPARKQRDTGAQAFQTEMERERLRREVTDTAWNERQNAAWTGRTGAADEPDGPETAAETGPEPGAQPGQAAGPGQTSRQAQAATQSDDPLWRRGLAAYAKARDMLLSDAARSRGTRLAVA